MRTPIKAAVWICAVLLLLTSACRRKKEMQQSGDLESVAKSFPATEPAQTPAQPPGTPPMPAPATEMQAAVQAYKLGQLEEAVTRLCQLRARPGMTAQQYMSVNDAIDKAMNEIGELAAKGDPRAAQALKQYEKMRTGQK